MTCFSLKISEEQNKVLIHGKTLYFCKCPRAAKNGIAGRSLPSPGLDHVADLEIKRFMSTACLSLFMDVFNWFFMQ